jgi:hypothetical protein
VHSIWRIIIVMAGMRRWRGRLWLASAVGAAGAAGLALLLAGGALRPQSAVSQARSYLDASACLLTSPAGIAQGSAAAPVWTSMQAASLTTHVMVSYLPETGPADTPVMLSTLIQRRCGVIITAGPDPGQVIAAARAHPGQRFLVVTASTLASLRLPGNAVVVPAASAPSQIDQALRTLAAAA